MTNWAEIDPLLLDYDFYKTDAYLDAFKKLRDEDPVHWTEDPKYGKNYWALPLGAMPARSSQPPVRGCESASAPATGSRRVDGVGSGRTR